MARQTETAAEATEAAAAVATADGAAPAAAATGARPRISFAIRTVGDKNYAEISGFEEGKEVTRQEYITKRWTVDGVERGEIARELSDLEGKKVAYQIVFQGTKNKTQAGKPAAEAPAAEGEAAEAPAAE